VCDRVRTIARKKQLKSAKKPKTVQKRFGRLNDIIRGKELLNDISDLFRRGKAHRRRANHGDRVGRLLLTALMTIKRQRLVVIAHPLSPSPLALLDF
jgi:hypothetical protein